jgi:hypothetical protein
MTCPYNMAATLAVFIPLAIVVLGIPLSQIRIGPVE